jgi:hypothetical protein
MTAQNSWLGLCRVGLAAARLPTPDVDSQNFAMYYATDTGVFSLWNGSAWVTLGGAAMASIARNANLAATGTNLATAAQLVAGFTAVTLADDTVGVKLPATPVAGTVVIVKSTVSNKILKVYPDAAATINAIGANAAISLASGPTIAMFIADSTIQWYTLPLLPS